MQRQQGNPGSGEVPMPEPDHPCLQTVARRTLPLRERVGGPGRQRLRTERVGRTGRREHGRPFGVGRAPAGGSRWFQDLATSAGRPCRPGVRGRRACECPRREPTALAGDAVDWPHRPSRAREWRPRPERHRILPISLAKSEGSVSIDERSGPAIPDGGRERSGAPARFGAARKDGESAPMGFRHDPCVTFGSIRPIQETLDAPACTG